MLTLNSRRVLLSLAIVGYSLRQGFAGAEQEARPQSRTNPDHYFTDPNAPSPRVIGGKNANPGRYPYLVDLDEDDEDHYCMGSLIAENLVLTAAHCGGSYMKWARVGRYDKTMPITENFKILKEITHPLFNSRTFEWDFLILRLDGTSSNTPINLNTDSKIPSDGAMLNLAGFGDVDPSNQNEDYPDFLQQVALQYMSNSQCEQSSGPYYSYQGEITQEMLCARDDGKDSCQGDSGSPLILAGATANQDLQVGLVSWGLDCADPLYPGVYGRVSTGYQWIREVVCDESDNPPASFACGNASNVASPASAPAPADPSNIGSKNGSDTDETKEPGAVDGGRGDLNRRLRRPIRGSS